MSANNLTACPRCTKRAREKHEANVARLSGAYGIVAEKLYNELSQLVADGIQIDKTALCEYWGIGTNSDGEFMVSYECHCETCGFHREFTHTEVFSLEEET